MKHGTGRAATILHADLDAFYASVVLLDEPSLAGKPVAVGGGVVLSCTYEARAFGVEGGMGIRQARQLCPDLVVVDAEFSSFTDYSDQVFEVFRSFTPLVEGISIDEAFLDVAGATHLFGSPASIGEQLRAAVRDRTELPISVGVARTKFLAKVASRVAKPDGLIAVAPEAELDFLHPLSVDHLWGVGPVTVAKLRGLGILSVGDLASTPVTALQAWLGPHGGAHLWALAWNTDPRPVVVGRGGKSIGSQSAFGGDRHDPHLFSRVLARLAERVGTRMRKKGLAGRTLTLRVRFADFQSITRATTMRTPSAATAVLHRTALRSLEGVRTEQPDRGIGLLGISMSKLVPASPLQLELPMFSDLEGGSPRELELQALDGNVDEVRERFGKDAVGRASVLLDPARSRFAEGLSDLMTR